MSSDTSELREDLKNLAQGPDRLVKCYKGCFVNDYRFHIKEHGTKKATLNYGVFVKGDWDGENRLDYYGFLKEVLELSYWGNKSLVLFNCDWIDPFNGIKYDKKHDVVDVNMKKILKTQETFALASQALQVSFVPKVSKKGRPNERSNEHVLLIPSRANYYDDFQVNGDVEEVLQTECSSIPSRVSIDPALDDVTRTPENLVVYLDNDDEDADKSDNDDEE